MSFFSVVCVGGAPQLFMYSLHQDLCVSASVFAGNLGIVFFLLKLQPVIGPAALPDASVLLVKSPTKARCSSL